MSERCRLYLISPPAFELKPFAEIVKRTLGAGDVASFQLRLKNVHDDEIRRATEVLMPIVQKHDVAFILNDLPDLAHELRCDGVHVGQDDASYAEARRIVGPNAIVGVTCHDSRHLAMEAAEAGADYVAFGAFFPTTTKEPKARADIETLHWWAEMMVVPCVAIGGITTENAQPLVEAGADFLAVASGVWDHKDGPAAAVKAFNAIFGA
ncbi:MAG: thiamine phosphate synthase [Proteobacteria bacterium]|nr:thiamine phosphate synthase [Pseudomonadota bacterium]